MAKRGKGEAEEASERQNLNLAKFILTADQINLNL